VKNTLVYILLALHFTSICYGSAVPVIETAITTGTADDYYTGSRARLKVVPASKIGPKVVQVPSIPSSLTGMMGGPAAMASLAFYQHTGQDPVYAAASAVASAADQLFVPAFQAFKANFVSPESYPATAAQYVGVEGSVGATVGNVIAHVRASAEGLYDDLKQLIAQFTAEDTADWDALDPVHTINTDTLGSWKVPASWNGTWGSPMLEYMSYFNGLAQAEKLLSSATHYYYLQKTSATMAYLWKINHEQVAPNDARHYCWRISLIPSTGYEPLPVYEGAVNHPGLKDALASPSPGVAQNIQDAIKDMPGDQKIVSSNPSPTSVPASSAYPITNNQVNNFFTNNTTQIYNQYNDIANNSASTATEIAAAKAAADLAKAQEEEAQQQEEPEPETFPPVASNGFEEPYDPGEYDIPERFSSFLDTVKSSGLFSFSSSFFNSLPGGGSPIYTVDGGLTFGSHTIDLSQTMSVGLAVLKTILLACFGFLSIRAVIMKR